MAKSTPEIAILDPVRADMNTTLARLVYPKRIVRDSEWEFMETIPRVVDCYRELLERPDQTNSERLELLLQLLQEYRRQELTVVTPLPRGRKQW